MIKNNFMLPIFISSLAIFAVLLLYLFTYKSGANFNGFQRKFLNVELIKKYQLNEISGITGIIDFNNDTYYLSTTDPDKLIILDNQFLSKKTELLTIPISDQLKSNF